MNRNNRELGVKAESGWIMLTLDIVAEEMFGEFGYNTLKPTEQQKVWMEILRNEERFGVIFS